MCMCACEGVYICVCVFVRECIYKCMYVCVFVAEI